MVDEIATQSESQMCVDCAELNSAACDVCFEKNRWKSKQRTKGKKGKKDAPEAPVVHEDGTIEEHITNPEAVDALEKCKHHGETVDVNEDGVTFCTECGLAVSTNPVPEEEPRKCSDCNDVNVAERCIYCGGNPHEDRAGDKFIPENEPVQDDEPNWDTYHDRSAEVPDPMMEEGQGEPQHALVPVDAPAEPWWVGGPLDTVTPKGESIGLPWHTAVLKCPVGRSCLLLPGDYNYSGVKATNIGSLHTGGPMDPDTVIQHMLLAAEQDAKAESVTEYRPGHNGQSTLDGEPMVRGRIDRKDVTQVHIEVDKYYLNTTEEGLAKALEEEKMSLKQWVYHKMRPLSMDTHIEDDDWKEGCKQFLKVIKGAA